jgi:hypothetical protein
VSSGHGEHEIKTITISSNQGIKALYCTDCSEIVTYLFDKDEWTMTEAQEWVDEHKEDGLSATLNKASGLNRKAREIIGGTVRYKSYGMINHGKVLAGKDNEELKVRGFFTDDKIDEVGDIITKEATVDAVERWRQWGNIRTMHDFPSGRVESIGKGDGLAWNEIVTVPVDEQTQRLIEGDVLKAYSVGIIPTKYELNEEALEEAAQEAEENGEELDWWFWPLIIHAYDMIEISYVDHPANYSATIQDIGKAAAKSFEHRAVLFKNSAITDGIDKMSENDNGELLEEQEVPAQDVEEAEKDIEEKDVDEVEPEVIEADIEESEPESEEKEAGEAEGPEGSEEEVEPEFDAALAVRELSERFDALERMLEEDFATAIVERVLDALGFEEAEPGSEDKDANEEPPVEKANEEPDDEVEPLTPESLKGFALEIRKGIVEDVIEALAPNAKRTAMVSVGGGEGDEEEPVDKTKKFLDMDASERRSHLRDAVAEAYPRE